MEKQTDKQKVIDEAWRMAKFAKNAYDYNLVYEALGFIKGLCACGIPYSEVSEINTFLVRNGLNNPEWFHEVERREKQYQ